VEGAAGLDQPLLLVVAQEPTGNARTLRELSDLHVFKLTFQPHTHVKVQHSMDGPGRFLRRPPQSGLHRRRHMKLGLRIPQRLGVDLQNDVVEAARTAEAAGYHSWWTYERLLFPQTPAEPYAEQPNVPWPKASRQAPAPPAGPPAAAVVTQKARLGVSLLVAALHTPVQLAKALATIDQ